MKGEEKSYLKKIKRSNGLDYSEAEEEIKALEYSQKQFKILNRDMKRKDTIIRNLEKKLEKSKDKVETLKNKLLKRQKEVPILKKNSQLGKDIFKEDTEKEISRKEKLWRKYKNRTFNNMETGETYTKSDILKNFFVPRYVFDWAIEKLTKEDLIDSKEVEGRLRYFKK